MSQRVAILGATSAIATEAARIWAARSAEFFLVGRSQDKLQALQQDLQVRGASRVVLSVCDLNDFGIHQALVAEGSDALGGIDIVLIAFGTLSDQSRSESDVSYARAEIDTNFVSPLSICTHVANYLEQRGTGTLAVISSVAGDRGRQSNYLYGSAKAGLGAFLQGLRNRLCAQGVHVLTIKPGFVDTPMTSEIKKNFLFATAQAVGQGIVDGIDKRRNVVYLPWFWCFIMLVIRLIPEAIFKRMKL